MSDDKKRGLYGKYYVERRDGKPLKGGMAIVLELGDPLTHSALLEWADTVKRHGYEKLAKDIRGMIAEQSHAIAKGGRP